MKRIDDYEDGGGPIEVPDPPTEPADTLVVEVEITKPTVNEELVGSATSVTVVVEGTARIVQGTGSIERVEVEVGGGGFRPAETGSGWATWALPVLVTSVGSLQVKARAVANGQTFPERAVTITTRLNPDAPDPSDTTPPKVAILTPKAGTALVLSGGLVEVSVAGTASDVGAGVKEVTLSVDGRAVPTTPANDTWANWSARAQLIGAGRHTVAATATDRNGLQTTARIEVITSTEPLTAPVVERLLLVEKLRLTTFRREYGVGKPIKVISLAPRERTTLAVKTFRRTSETATEASSILDSSTREAQDEFERQLLTEQTNKRTAEESVDWNVGGQAAADWGWGSATMNAGASGSTNGSREELAKCVMNAVQKQAAKATAKREVEIKTSREMKAEESEEFSSESVIENQSSSRTLNLIFSEVNQRFLSILHLVDIRLAYVRGDLVTDETGEHVNYSYREVTLSQLDGLLRQVIVPERREEVRARILEALAYVFDWEETPHAAVEEAQLKDPHGNVTGTFLRFPKRLRQRYPDETSPLEVPGIILAVTENVLRTDGTVCDTAPGQGDARDGYATEIERHEIRARELENLREREAIEKERLAIKLVKDGNEAGAKLFKEIYPAPESDSLALVTASNGTGTP